LVIRRKWEKLTFSFYSLVGSVLIQSYRSEYSHNSVLIDWHVLHILSPTKCAWSFPGFNPIPVLRKARGTYRYLQHQQVDKKALMSTQPELKAKMETKRKNREWSENWKVIEGIFRKPAKLLQKEKKQVAQLLDEKFPPNVRDLEAGSSGKEDAASREFLSCHMTSTERLEARLGSVSKRKEWWLISWAEGKDEERPRDSASAIPRSWRHLWRDFTWFSNPFCVLQGVPQEKQKDTMINEYERVDFVAVLYVVMSG
jgi:hypothetical protein